MIVFRVGNGAFEGLCEEARGFARDVSECAHGLFGREPLDEARDFPDFLGGCAGISCDGVYFHLCCLVKVNGFDSGCVASGDGLFWLEVENECDCRIGGGGGYDERGGSAVVFLNGANDARAEVLPVSAVEPDEIRGGT